MSSLIPHDYRYKISSPTPVDKEPIKINKKKHHTNGGVSKSKLFSVDSVFFVEAFDTSISLSEFLTSCVEWMTV